MGWYASLCCSKRTLISCKFLHALFSLLLLYIRWSLFRGPPCVLRSLKPQQKDKNIKNQQGSFSHK